MSASPVSALGTHAIIDNLFAIEINQKHKDLVIRMNVYTSSLTTGYYPKTIALLNHHLPSIFKTKCFNDFNQPFLIEAADTEIAHLFEHIFLAFLHRDKLSISDESFTYSGVTSWNWQREPKGLFHITITGTENDYSLISWF